MKIAVLGTRGFPGVQGGVEKHCENLYPRLSKKGCEIVVLARKTYIGSNVIDYKGVRVVPLSCPKHKFLEAFLHTFYGVFVAKKIGFDILHIHAIGPSLFVPFARILGLKVVMTNHGPDYKRKKWGRFAKLVLRLGEFLGLTFANKVIAISKNIADEIKMKYHREVAVIPNGVIIAKILKSDNALRKYTLDIEKYILSVGRFVPEKGFHDLLDAFNEIRLDGWKLVIVGRADHEDRYSLNLKEKASKNRNIVLTGFLTGEPLQELYSHAGLFVLPSYYEGLPIVLLEAMSYGLLCLASDIPANREVVGLSEERFFKAGDVQALAGKIGEFIDRPLTEEERKRQMDMVAEWYNWERIAERTLEVYRRVEKGRIRVDKGWKVPIKHNLYRQR